MILTEEAKIAQNKKIDQAAEAINLHSDGDGFVKIVIEAHDYEPIHLDCTAANTDMLAGYIASRIYEIAYAQGQEHIREDLKRIMDIKPNPTKL
jgi:hypothetical protein